jgi:hypothetical protein
MNITICGSIACFDEMITTKAKLEELGHKVDMPPSTVKNEQGEEIDVREYYKLRKAETDQQSEVWDIKKKAMLAHFHKVEWSDAILVLNLEKNGIPGYIGANTLLEMGLALHLNKKIFLYNPVPEQSPYLEEILGCKGITINHNFSQIT